MNAKLYMPYPESAPGDFYNVEGECMFCGVPQVVAPDLVGWIEAEYVHCYWIKQPKTPGELERAFLVFEGQEAGCHRYSGTDPLIQIRVGSGNCDYPSPALQSSVRRATAPLRGIGNLFSDMWGKPSSPEPAVNPRSSLLRRFWQRLAQKP